MCFGRPACIENQISFQDRYSARFQPIFSFVLKCTRNNFYHRLSLAKCTRVLRFSSFCRCLNPFLIFPIVSDVLRRLAARVRLRSVQDSSLTPHFIIITIFLHIPSVGQSTPQRSNNRTFGLEYGSGSRPNAFDGFLPLTNRFIDVLDFAFYFQTMIIYRCLPQQATQRVM